MLCLLDLNYDVLLRIFTYLDIASVLRSARVSSACNRLAQSKHVWLAIVFDLGCRHLLDLPPRDTLLRFSTTQLMKEVKRAVFGPRTWAANSSSAPAVRQHIHVSMSGPGSSPPSEPTLLSGDKHLLVTRGTGCEIWDITEGRRIWARDGILRRHVVAQPVHDGAGLLIALCTGQSPILTLDPALLNFKLLVQVFLLDLKTNSERRMPPIQLPRTCSVFYDPVIADDIWAANVQWLVQNGDCYQGVLFVNWRETTFVLLHCSVRLVHKQVEYPVLPGFRTPFMSVHDCLLHRGSYLVSTHTASSFSLPADSEDSRRPALHRYRLTLPTSTPAPPTWERISCAGTINCVYIDSFTYAGYGMSFPTSSRRPVPRLVCRPATGESTVDGMWTVPLPGENPGCVGLSPDTGKKPGLNGEIDTTKLLIPNLSFLSHDGANGGNR
ncbi:hypothetical protein DFH09DRAFT_1080492 [Mycena vulgaris]|nr:hypothetical protein DFH09DRAFT_1080492 [Mycena vulgaris]